MPSFSREMGDLDNNENTVVVSDSKDKQCENEAINDIQRIKSNKLTEEEMTAIDMRDFLSTAPGILVKVEDNSTPSPESSPSPTKKGPEALTSEEHPLQYIDDEEEERVSAREVDETLNNAACRLRRWRAASRKLRRPRIIDNLCEGRGAAASRTDLADRLRSLAAAGGLSASAGELLSLAPPPPAATAPPSPGCLLTPTLADQSANDYFGSSPECCADIIGGSTVGAPVPAPGPRYKLVSECATRVCFFQHTRTVMDKILAAKFLRRWETHVLYLLDDHVVAKTPCGLLDKPLPYSSMLEVYCITRWDPARKYCLRIVTPLGSLLLQANEVYTRDQWFHSIIWRRHIVRYKRILTKSNRKEVVLKELKNMVDYVMTTPLQDEVVTRTPMDILTTLLSENKESPDWEDWAECLVSCAAPMLAERCANGELCAMLARLCRQRPRSAPLPALGPPVRRVLTRNVDFARAPNARRFVRDYISALSAHNSGPSLVRRFVEVTHGNGAKCPHPRAAPNLAAVALAALDEHYRDKGAPHLCEDTEDEVLCFAYILEHMCEYEDWRVVVSGVLQPVPLCAGVMRCPRVAKSLGAVLGCMARDPRCAVHACLAPARTARPHPPTWLKVAAPSEGLLALSHTQLCQLWGDMLGGLINCCCKRKSFLQNLSKQLPDFVIVALTEHPAVLESICCMLEWELTTDEQTQLEMIAALQATDLGKKYYTDLCTRQINLQILQSEGGPRKLALPVRATDQDVAALLETGSLGNLECLSLAFTSVTSECAQHLIKLPSLRYLNLWATQFGDSGVQLIAEHLPRLQVLNLCETPVSDKGIEALSALSNLRRLNLNSTRLSSEAFDTLRQRLPHLQEYDVRYTEAW